MKKIMITSFIMCNLLLAENWQDLDKSFNDNYTKRWKEELNINKEKAKIWIELFDFKANDLSKVKQYIDSDVNNPNEAIKWKEVGISDSYLKNWKQIQITPNEYRQWKEIGFSDSNYNDIKKLQSLNVTVEQALSFKEVGVSYYDIDDLVSMGINNGNQYSQLKELIGTSYIKDWAKIGLIDINAIKKWLDLGFNKSDYYSIEEILKNDITYEQYEKAVKVYGLPATRDSLEKIKKLINHNINYDQNEISDWKKVGVQVMEIEDYKSKGIDSPTILKEWHLALRKAGDRNYDYDSIINSPSPYREYFMESWTNDDVKAYRVAELYKLDLFEIIKITKNLETALPFLNNGIYQSYKIEEQLKNGLSINETKQWEKAILSYSDDPDFPKYVQEWKLNGFLANEETLDWNKAVGINNAAKAAKYKNIGLTPNIVKTFPEWVLNNSDSKNLINKIKKACTNIVTYHDLMYEIPQNQQKNTCFVLGGRLVGKIEGIPAFNSHEITYKYAGQNFFLPYTLIYQDNGMFSDKYPKTFDTITASEKIGAIVKLDDLVDSGVNSYLKLFVIAHSKE